VGLVALRGRRAGGGRKPPRAAAAKSRGGERRGKSRALARQVWITKASASEPLMKRRNNLGDIKTRESFRPWDESGGCLLIGQAVSGVEVARAWSGLSCGTCEPVPRWAAGQWSGCGLRLVVWSENSERLIPRGGE
jgi:hypothetical protein